MGRRRLHLPDNETILKHLSEGWSVVALARHYGADLSSAYKVVKRIGVNTSRSRHGSTCKMPGCEKPVKKVWHAVHKKFYGRLCATHRREYYASHSRERQRKQKGLSPEQFKPWERKHGTLSEYEKETLWIIQAKKKLKQARQLLKQQERRAAS